MLSISVISAVFACYHASVCMFVYVYQRIDEKRLI